VGRGSRRACGGARAARPAPARHLTAEAAEPAARRVLQARRVHPVRRDLLDPQARLGRVAADLARPVRQRDPQACRAEVADPPVALAAASQAARPDVEAW
jgi:hypothetical protein